MSDCIHMTAEMVAQCPTCNPHPSMTGDLAKRALRAEANAFRASNAAFLEKRRADEAEAKLEAVIAARDMMGRMWAGAEAKLAKAVNGFKDVIGMLDDPHGGEHVRDMRGATLIARKALAKLKGDTND